MKIQVSRYPLKYLILLVILISCGKKVNRPDCGTIQDISISQNRSVNEGDSLVLTLPEVAGTSNTYRWSGPQGYSFETSDALLGKRRVIKNISKSNSGTYKVQLLNRSEGCVQFEGSINVSIGTATTIPPTDTIPNENPTTPPIDTTTNPNPNPNPNPPTPPTDTTANPNPNPPTPPTPPIPPVVINPVLPCSVTANTSTSTSNTGKFEFKFTSFAKNGNEYSVKGNETQNGNYMEFKFKINGQLKPGTYKTNGTGTASQVGSVGLHIKTALLDYVAAADQIVYVSLLDGKFQISICSVKFTNTLDLLSNNIITARILEP